MSPAFSVEEVPRPIALEASAVVDRQDQSAVLRAGRQKTAQWHRARNLTFARPLTEIVTGPVFVVLDDESVGEPRRRKSVIAGVGASVMASPVPPTLTSGMNCPEASSNWPRLA